MKLRHIFRTSGTLSLSLILPLSFPLLAHAKKDAPSIFSTRFTNSLENVFYFDDSNVIIGRDGTTNSLWRSSDAGETWDIVQGDDHLEGNVWDIWPHPWDSSRAYAIGVERMHWMTNDRGATWKKIPMLQSPEILQGNPMAFHGRDPKKVIFNAETCVTILGPCESTAFYTLDDFETVSSLTKGTRGGCQWAVATPDFGADLAPEVDDRIFCIKEGLYSPWAKDYRLVSSDDFFADGAGAEPGLDEGRAVSGVISIAAVKNFVVAATKAEGTDELALFVTADTQQWHRAEFGKHRIVEDAYTILESTNYSLQVDVLGSKMLNPMGHLFTSNSNGTYFTKNIDYTNRNFWGRVDFEKVAGIQGIVLVNTVENFEEVQGSISVEKVVISQISFDDGRTFQKLSAGKKDLHLHSVTEARQSGRIFSSPAPGIVMGVGNTGKQLKAYEDGDLYVSDDAGLTWSKALSGSHLYEFGNFGAVLVAIKDDEVTDVIQYSLDHGKNWKDAKLDKKIKAKFLTTVPDSTTLKFLVGGVHGSGDDAEWYISKLDFEGLHERTCGGRDFDDKWPARKDGDGKPSCIMGHKQFYRRRKADADCVIDNDFKDPLPTFESCECSIEDFECDYNFERSEDRKTCVPVGPLPIPEGKCKDPSKDTFMGTSGWRRIPGNECKGGVQYDAEIERPCTDTVKKPVSGEVSVEKTHFKSSFFRQWFYLERSGTSQGNDETIIMSTDDQGIYITRDHGKTWQQILKDESNIVDIVPNPNFHDVIYFLTGTGRVIYSVDRGEKFDEFEAPKPPSTIPLPRLKFHPDYKDWLLWSGQDKGSERTNIYYTRDRGDHWDTLVRGARKCDFIHRADKDELIFCEQYEKEDPDTQVLRLLSSDNLFADSTVHYPDILDFATMSEFIIVAQKTDDRTSLKVDASVDGQTFAPAEFPLNFQVKHQQAYTVLDSSTHAVFLHVTVNPVTEHEYGTIIKSNSNGTHYVKVLDYVNRDMSGYVDFEKMQGLEGVAMVNVVTNPSAVDDGSAKKLQSFISHNDGSDWTRLSPPKTRAGGGNYDCVSTDGKSTEDCALHIHSYTERTDKLAIFSSPTAVGLMMAVGNVGPELLSKSHAETDTFITSDAGLTWKSVKRGSFMWEYGDQGSIIVIVPEDRNTKSIFYSLDEGDSWKEFEFSEQEMLISSITTVPSDNSRNFLLWGREVGPGNTQGVTTVNLDFTELVDRQRQCDLNEEHPSDSKDYYLWEPKHPFQSDNCLFGHVAQYHRKKRDAKCFNGKRLEDGPHSISRNCSCTRQDFECDFNYQRNSDGTCSLVPGYQPPDHEQVCKDNPEAIEWFYPTGYRRIPLSTCQGGQELDTLEPQPCPGHLPEFEKKRGGSLGGFAIFALVFFSVTFAGGIGYWIWDQYQKRGGLGFGAIRLGESLSSATAAGRSVGSGDSPFITVPVAMIAGVVAVGRALPLLVTSLFRSAKGYVPIGRSNGYAGGPYRSRDSFANRRQDFASPAYVEDDELLGDEDDEGEEV